MTGWRFEDIDDDRLAADASAADDDEGTVYVGSGEGDVLGEGTFRYRVGVVTKALGVSRASLMYYESAGLVTPQRVGAGGVREYDDEDIYDLITYHALHNIGFTAKEIAAAKERGPELFDEDHIEAYLDRVGEKIKYYEALRESIERLRRVRAELRRDAVTKVEAVERWLFVPDSAEQGFAAYRKDAALDAMLDCMPIAGFGVRFDYDSSDELRWIWGRTIPLRLVSVAGVGQAEGIVVGGCDCLTQITWIDSARQGWTQAYFDTLAAKVVQMGRRLAPLPDGRPFMVGSFPPHAGVPFKICMPLADK